MYAGSDLRTHKFAGGWFIKGRDLAVSTDGWIILFMSL
jgi:hypothetical protein